MRWPWQKRTEPTVNRAVSIGDPALAGYFNPGGLVDLAGVAVNEHTALGLSAFYRAVTLIAGTLASMPMPTYTAPAGALRKQVASTFDEPDGEFGQTAFEWKESAFLHLVIHGRCGGLKLRTGAGAIERIPLFHPLTWRPVEPSIHEYQTGRLPVGGLWFDVRLDTGQTRRFDATDFWYVPGPAMDKQFGMGVLQVGRSSLGTSIAAEKAAAKTFSNGALISGLAVPDYDDGLDITADVPEIRRQLDRSVSGYENAGAIAVINRRLKFTPWTMTAEQAQFLQSRQFQIEEVSRWTGVPPHLLMQTEKQTSWGTGVEMQDRALARSVLGTWSKRFEERASRELPRPRFVEFDFTALERPSPDKEIELDLQQVKGGVMTVDEYRARRGWEALPADVSRETSQPQPDVSRETSPDDGQGNGDAPPAQ